MRPTGIAADNTIFVLISFEGPDQYSLAGGLGVRVTNLSQTLASHGFTTHLFFIGDPKGRGEEIVSDGRLILHRWCQWISNYYPQGVYQGENEKLYDFNKSLPEFVIENVIKPAIAEDKLVVILGEEWHTTEVMYQLSNLLGINGLRDRVVMFWNANNTFGFERILWKQLAEVTTITTVSRYMKHIMQGMGLNSLVIPNGIPASLLNGVDAEASAKLRRSIPADLLLTKVARWDPAKRWDTALEAIARLKDEGRKTVLLARGGMEPYGKDLIDMAQSLDLTVKEVNSKGNALEDYFEAICNKGKADILNIKFHCPQEFLRILYHASDGVLANSGHEPFGLVGLETMAAGGVAFTGDTGEDYAMPFSNSIVLRTDNPEEIESNVIYLDELPDESERIRKAAWQTAREYTWERVIKILFRKLEYQARTQGLLGIRKKPAFPIKKPSIHVEAIPDQGTTLVGSV
ncbi:MAG: glycosyltransferase [Dehalococcoidales bacterium]|nr:glycosyltransferase [Dehalococcoidales bacterium]